MRTRRTIVIPRSRSCQGEPRLSPWWRRRRDAGPRRASRPPVSCGAVPLPLRAPVESVQSRRVDGRDGGIREEEGQRPLQGGVVVSHPFVFRPDTEDEGVFHAVTTYNEYRLPDAFR